MTLLRPHPGRPSRLRRAAAALGLAATTVLAAETSHAASPPANAVIGNQASASYTDGSGATKSATSNLVETTVRQIGSLTIDQDNAKTAAIGNTVYMPHTLTNTGNGADGFVLGVADPSGADTDFATGIAIYADSNGDGLPDSTTPLCAGIGCSATTPSLPAGGRFSFVVAMTVPGGAAAAQTDQIVVSASGATPALYDGNGNGVFGEAGDAMQANTDALTVTAAAAFQVSKSVSLSQGPTGIELAYTMTYQNIGAVAGHLALHDVIGSGATAGLAYVPGSAVWSAGGSALSDAYTVGTPDATVGGSQAHYEAVTAAGITTLRATLTSIAPNVTGTLSFRATVRSTAAVGTTTTSNAARFGADDDTDPTNNTLSQATNAAAYAVLASRGVVLNDGSQSAGTAVDGDNARPLATDVDSPANPDLARQPSATPGQTLSFTVSVWNGGNASDSFNLSAATLPGGAGYGSWPAGTSIQLLKSDGATPLTDSGGDGAADTGLVAAGAALPVVVRITLPPAACIGGCPAGPFDVRIAATAVGDPSQSNATFVRLGALAAPGVDLANASGSVDSGVNQDAPGAAPTVTQTVAPAATAVFDLVLRNEGGVADTYALVASASAGFAPATPLPDGWSLQFRTVDATGHCSATGGSVIGAAGPVAPGAETKVCAVVVTAPGAVAGATDVHFQATSQVSGATDSLWDRVTVSEVNQLTLQPSHTGQVFAGGTVVYPHTLSNTGNTSCASPIGVTLGQSLAAQGWTTVLYRDVNGDGAIDAGDTLIDTAGGLAGVALAPTASVKLLVKVFAPAGAAAGSADVVSLSASATCGAAQTTSNTISDVSTVISGQVRLVKTQAIDHDCDGTPSLPVPDPAVRATGTTFAATPMQALPGECILYRVVATNEGLGTVSALQLIDSQPAYTLFSDGPACSAGTPSHSAPTYRCADVTLAPAATVSMGLRVQVRR